MLAQVWYFTNAVCLSMYRRIILCYTTLFYSVLYYTILYCTLLCNIILYYTKLYCTIVYYSVIYYTILYCIMLYCIIQYYTQASPGGRPTQPGGRPTRLEVWDADAPPRCRETGRRHASQRGARGPVGGALWVNSGVKGQRRPRNRSLTKRELL